MATAIHVDGQSERVALPENPADARRVVERLVGGVADRLVGFDNVFVRRRYSELPLNPLASARFGRFVGGTALIIDDRERDILPQVPGKRQQVMQEIRRRQRLTDVTGRRARS